MTAKYFYERLIKYPEESYESGKYYYGYSNHSVEIHRKNNNCEYFIIRENGSVTKASISHFYERDFGNIDDLTGDDFELFSCVQIIKSGYLVLEKATDNPITDMRIIISRLHNYIDSLDNDFIHARTDVPHLCGGSCWSNGLTDYFTYHAVNGIELHIGTIKNLCEKNIERKYYDARCIPFIKSMDNNVSIHISFVHYMHENNYEEIRKKCNKSLNDLLKYMDTIGIKCKWVNCKMDFPVYL